MHTDFNLKTWRAETTWETRA